MRRIPFITFCIKPVKKAWINLAGCNFDCKGCFAVAKEEVGRLLSVNELIMIFIKSCQQIYGEVVDDVVITGGEPTLNPAYLVSLIRGLQEKSVTKIALSTNGYLLDENLVRRLKGLEVSLIKIDVKAFDEDLHYWYTGKSNRNVLRAIRLLQDYDLNFYVRTILMPGFVGSKEVEEIAQFLSSISRKIVYKIYEFDPKHARYPITRKPTCEEMAEAFRAARRYLSNVEAISASNTYNSSYEYVEVRDDGLLDLFKKIDEISRLSIKGWKMKSIPLTKILQAE